MQREYDRLFVARIERWLDAGDGACPLRQPEHAAVVGGALAHFEGERCGQRSWIVMPNHVHAVFSLHPAWTLEEMIKSWKIFSARRINAALGQSGALWQKDYFDWIVRDEDHFWKAAAYLRANPEKGNLRPGEFLAWESDEVKEVLDAEQQRT